MKKFSVFLAALILLSSLYLPPKRVDACTSAYFQWTWNTDLVDFDVYVYTNKCFSLVSTYCRTWNRILSNVHISTVSRQTETTAKHEGNINVYQKDLTGSTVGLTRIYRKVLGAWVSLPITTNKKVGQARIFLDKDLPTGSNVQTIRTIIHEFGHAFALRHPIEVGCNETCIMQQGGSGYGAMQTYLEAHDRNNFKKKWGN